MVCRGVKGFGGGLLCELCVGIKGLMKCLLQARGDRHWGGGTRVAVTRELVFRRVKQAAWTRSAWRSDCDHFIPKTMLHEEKAKLAFQYLCVMLFNYVL